GVSYARRWRSAGARSPSLRRVASFATCGVTHAGATMLRRLRRGAGHDLARCFSTPRGATPRARAAPSYDGGALGRRQGARGRRRGMPGVMQIQINTDRNIGGDERLAEHVEGVVRDTLSRFADQITRVE